MASLELQSGWYRINLSYNGRRYKRALDTQDETKALQLKSRIEENLTELDRGRLPYTGGDLIKFLISDGQNTTEPAIAKSITLGNYLASYLSNPPPGREPSSEETIETHSGHLLRLLGSKTYMADIDTAKLQGYIHARSRESNGRKNQKLISPVTIRMEITSFKTIWNSWGRMHHYVVGDPPTKGLRYPKIEEKHRWLSWDQIKREIKRGGKLELWDCLFLTTRELPLLFDYLRGKVEEKPSRHFLYAMIIFAAHTGARRSEIMASLKEDIDFDANGGAGGVVIRQKKSDKSKTFTLRHVPMTPLLKTTLQEWFKVHPGGPRTFSCKKADRPLLRRGSIHGQFRKLLADSPWQVIRGWHVLRHSFISACVMNGMQQRVIDKLVGHSTEAMRRRYTHLDPNMAHAALTSVFAPPSQLALTA